MTLKEIVFYVEISIYKINRTLHGHLGYMNLLALKVSLSAVSFWDT